MIGEEDTKLVFKSEEEKNAAFDALPDEPPLDVDIEGWQKEQDIKSEAILSAEVVPGTDTSASVEKFTEKSSEEELTSPAAESITDEEVIDFTVLGKVKRSELPENLRKYPNPHEILKQADHARRFANGAEDKIQQYEKRIAELEEISETVPGLKKQLEEMQSTLARAKQEVQNSPSNTQISRQNISNKLRDINSKLANLKEYGGEETEVVHSTISDVVGTLNSTFDELDKVRAERRNDTDRIKKLEERIESVAHRSFKNDADRIAKEEQTKAERALMDLQRDNSELRTSLPLYSDDGKDVESAVVKLTSKIFGRQLRSFDEVNRVVGAFNAKDADLKAICDREGISPADYGINEMDIRNYGILMEVYWRQRGERIDPSSGKRIPVTDFRNQKVVFPNYQSAFDHLKNTSGLTQAERELEVTEAEKQGQNSLERSLRQRDTASKVIEPGGVPLGGSGMSEEEALEIIGANSSHRTIDEEKMELLLRDGKASGWEMFKKYQTAHEVLKMPVPKTEEHWLKSA